MGRRSMKATSLARPRAVDGQTLRIGRIELRDDAAGEVSFAVLHGLYWLAVNLAARRPLIMAVDDAHWVDGPSLRWLAYLAPRLGGLPVALILALRPAEAASEQPSLLVLHEQAAVVRPGLLSENATSEIVRSVISGAADELCAAAWRESGGNPS